MDGDDWLENWDWGEWWGIDNWALEILVVVRECGLKIQNPQLGWELGIKIGNLDRGLESLIDIWS